MRDPFLFISSVAPKDGKTAGGRSRRGLLVFAITFAIVFGAAHAAAVTTFGSLAIALRYLRGERLMLEPRHLEFGNLPASETITLGVDIRNYTPRAVTLLGATTACTCVVATGLPLAIGAGQHARIPIEVTLKPSDRHFDETLVIFTDCESHPKLGVCVKAYPRVSVAKSPASNRETHESSFNSKTGHDKEITR